MPDETQIFSAQRVLSTSEQRERWLAALAGRQHGVVARQQLLRLGFSSHQIERMRRIGRLHDVHRGVYAVGHSVLSTKGRWMAAVLACGPGALLSHRSAAALRQVHRSAPSYVEVIVPARRGRIPGIRAHVSTRVAAQDRDVVDGIPCTSLALTLLNLAAVCPRRVVERACDEAVVQEVFDLTALDDVLARSPRCHGAPLLRSVLADHAIGTTLTRPGLEERTLRLLDGAGVPRPEVNIRLSCRPGVAHEVDFLWRMQRLVLETDGGRFHSDRRQIERDRRREADLVRAGYRVLRATWLQVQDEPQDVALMVRAALRNGYASSSA